MVGFPGVPYGLRGWVEDLGDPDIPGGEIHRCGEDGCRDGEEESSQGSREFHRKGSGVVGCGGGGSDQRNREVLRLEEGSGEGNDAGVFVLFVVVGAAVWQDTEILLGRPGPLTINTVRGRGGFFLWFHQLSRSRPEHRITSSFDRLSLQ